MPLYHHLSPGFKFDLHLTGRSADRLHVKAKVFFIYINKIIRGPFAADEVLQLLNDKTLLNQGRIWWKGKADWMALREWTPAKIREVPTSPVQHTEWYVDYQGQQHGPMQEQELLDLLKMNQNYSYFYLWHVGLENWQTVYAFPHLLEQLGQAKRSNTRVPLLGTVSVELPQEKLVFDITSLSQEGIGVKDCHLPKGVVAKLYINSPALGIPVYTLGQVVYAKEDGHTAFHFKSLNAEALSAVIGYIRQVKDRQSLEQV